ncbi:uncharacterized protein PAF06_015486 [Gastrophryne carolinensis]
MDKDKDSSSNRKGVKKKVNLQKALKEDKEAESKRRGAEQPKNKDEPLPDLESNDVMVFEGLCDRTLSALCMLQASVSEVLDVKDELIQHNVPSSVQAQLSLSTSRLFRSLTDLSIPSAELVRLVRLFGPEWEQKRKILEQLQGEHERLQRLLSLALQRVQHLESQLHRDTESQHYKNWEKLFVSLMLYFLLSLLSLVVE